jgi:anaerobic selenocysteine-containing dehydrogenase
VRPSLWASLVPRDPRERKPNHYVEMARVLWRNRDELPYAWRVLNQGVCDGCALGTTGMRDWTLDGIHLCMVRLELLRLNTAPALDPERLRDVSALEGLSSRDLRELGRLPEPMIRRRGDKGFRLVSWDEAYDAAAEKIRATTPERLAVYLTSRGILNEHY